MAQVPSFTPLVLLIEDQEWSTSQLESVLEPGGYATFRAYSAQQGLEILAKMMPDVILVSARLPDMSGAEALRRIGALATVFPSTPKIAVSSGDLSHTERMELLQAGAWHVLDPPFDAEDLTLRMANWSHAKRDADQARDQGLIDAATGLYNFKGLLRRIEEVVSDAGREERFISLVMLGPASLNEEVLILDLEREVDLELPHNLARLLSGALRRSDAAGRVGHTEFAVVAPGTDESGGESMARRILDAIRHQDDSIPLRAGVYSVRGAHGEPVSSLDLLSHATAALRRAQERGEDESNGVTPSVQLN